MTPDLITLGVIRHEDTVHLVSPSTFIQRSKSVPNLKTPTIETTEYAPDLPPLPSLPTVTNTASATMGNPNDARTRALASMYGTSFVFSQNHKNFVQALPWSSSSQRRSSSPHNPVPSTEDIKKMASKLVRGRGNGRKEAADRQVVGMQSEKVKKEHAASLFALLT